MSVAYDALVTSGAVSSLKRDVLIEAAEDLFYLCHIWKWFKEEAGEEGAREAATGTVRVARELIDLGVCVLGTWGDNREVVPASKSVSELTEAVSRYGSSVSGSFELFLVATDAGRAWVARYQALVEELQP